MYRVLDVFDDGALGGAPPVVEAGRPDVAAPLAAG